MTQLRKRKSSLLVATDELTTPPPQSVLASPSKRFKIETPSSHSTNDPLNAPSLTESSLHKQFIDTLPEQSHRQHFYRLLQSLDKEALASLFTQVLFKHPFLEQEVSQLLPRPTLSTVTQLLQDSEKRLNDAFPYSKHAPGRTSDYSFNRVR
jgi:hypothetical protein